MSSLKKTAGRPSSEEQLERIANWVENPNAEPLPDYLQQKFELLSMINRYVNKYGGDKRAIDAIKKGIPELQDKEDRLIRHLIRDCLIIFINNSIPAAHTKNKLLEDLYYAIDLAKQEKDPLKIAKVAEVIVKLTRADRPEGEQVAIPPAVIVMAPMASVNVENFIPNDFNAINTEYEEIRNEISKRNEE